MRLFQFKKISLNFWNKYVSFVDQSMNVLPKATQDNIDFWRTALFIKFITYLLPSCFIALIPGVFMAIKDGFVVVGISDVAVVVSIAIIALSRNIKLRVKKIFVISILYLLAIMLIVNLSLLGPGTVYLVALSIIITLTCPAYWGYWTILANLMVCVFCGLIIHFGLFNSLLVKDYNLGTWIAVSSNLVFLSFVIVILVNIAVNGLERKILMEHLLTVELQKKNQETILTNELIKESEEQYKSLFFLNPSPMWVIDMDTLQFLQVNEAAIQKYGYTSEEFLSMNIGEIKLEEDMNSLRNSLQEIKSGEIISRVVVHKKKNRERFYVEVHFNSISYKGRPATLAILQDISQQMDYIKAIEEQNDKLKEIAWIQSHKVREPLTNILSLVQLFHLNLPSVETTDVMNGIILSSQKLDKVIKEIMDNTGTYEISKQFSDDTPDLSSMEFNNT
ncbi:MAG: PAS domain S-box protein [Bacteroidota bacterium]